jgi:hypothetical protein
LRCVWVWLVGWLVGWWLGRGGGVMFEVCIKRMGFLWRGIQCKIARHSLTTQWVNFMVRLEENAEKYFRTSCKCSELLARVTNNLPAISSSALCNAFPSYINTFSSRSDKCAAQDTLSRDTPLANPFSSRSDKCAAQDTLSRDTPLANPFS